LLRAPFHELKTQRKDKLFLFQKYGGKILVTLSLPLTERVNSFHKMGGVFVWLFNFGVTFGGLEARTHERNYFTFFKRRKCQSMPPIRLAALPLIKSFFFIFRLWLTLMTLIATRSPHTIMMKILCMVHHNRRRRRFALSRMMQYLLRWMRNNPHLLESKFFSTYHHNNMPTAVHPTTSYSPPQVSI